jgi:hypothetical protein
MGRHKDLHTRVHTFVRDDLHWSCEVKLTHSSVGTNPRTKTSRRNELSFTCINSAIREVWGIDYRNSFGGAVKTPARPNLKGKPTVVQARARPYKLNGGRDIWMPQC